VRAQTVTADFGDHSDPAALAYPIPSEIMGAQYSRVMPSTAMNTLYNGGFRRLRMHGYLQVVYTTQTANWTQLDTFLDAIKNANVGKSPGFKVTLELTYTPPWLVPTVTGCVQPGQANAEKLPPDPNRFTLPPDNDVTTWAKLAQSIVAHVDQKYPGLVTDFEIWNEPELPSFCVRPNDADTRFNRYAAAPLIRQQLAADGQMGRIGGPTITSTSDITRFVGGLVNNTSTAPYVDFISYHKYPSGQSDIDGGMTWDGNGNPNAAPQPLYNRIQSTNNLGFLQHYLSISNATKTGKQPNPTQTKIYLDEYNDNWAFSHDCCRNSPIYSPLFNGLVMVDMLNAVFAGAPHVPDSLEYYSLSNQPFCLLGDSGLQCGTSNYNTSYPQFYLYSLFASPNYLNLSAGNSFMAKSITPGATTSGLAATAFWSVNQNSIVIVNPSSTAYDNVQVSAMNPGFSVGNVTEYLLNDANRTITSFALAGSESVNVSVPAYSVVALKMTPGSGPEFSIAASPASQSVLSGGSTTYSVAVSALNGFTGNVTFAASGLPSGATASFNPASVSGSGSSTLSVTTSADTPTGTYPIAITATSGTLEHTTQVSLAVSGSIDFSLSVTPSSRTIAQNSWNTYSLTVSPQGGFNGVVTFATSGLPAGATATFTPTSITGSGTTSMMISCAGWTAPGNYTVNINATSGSIQHTMSVGLSVTGFSISVSPGSQSVSRGSSTTYTATITDLNGYSSTKTLSVTGLPSGATATFNPSSLPGSGTSTLTVQTAGETPIGTFTLSITATSGTLQHSAQVSLVVSGPTDFSLSVTPSSRTIAQHSWSSYSVTVSPQSGFSGVVTFAASGLPAGATATFTPTSITGSGTTSMLISCAGWTAPGNYTVNIIATSGSIQHTTSVGLSVAGFTISASPGSQSVSAGNSTTYTATIADLNGYSSTKTMSVTGLPDGATATFNPSSLTGSGTSTLTVQTAGETPKGTFTLSIRATSTVDGLYHAATVSLTVQ
jgi:glycosyl hydrolase family 39 (putative alpha-L-iduronidase)